MGDDGDGSLKGNTGERERRGQVGGRHREPRTVAEAAELELHKGSLQRFLRARRWGVGWGYER